MPLMIKCVSDMHEIVVWVMTVRSIQYSIYSFPKINFNITVSTTHWSQIWPGNEVHNWSFETADSEIGIIHTVGSRFVFQYRFLMEIWLSLAGDSILVVIDIYRRLSHLINICWCYYPCFPKKCCPSRYWILAWYCACQWHLLCVVGIWLDAYCHSPSNVTACSCTYALRHWKRQLASTLDTIGCAHGFIIYVCVRVCVYVCA